MISPPHSPPTMSNQSRMSSSDLSADAIRKRVCKACDRCRLKKSKCDGSSPCTRCKADNAICVFGERKKSHDKVYPKGYVEMLEQQQNQLVVALQDMYHRSLASQSWDGPLLTEANGVPLTHDILAALGLLESKHDGSGEMETFEEDCEKLQKRMLADGSGLAHRRSSMSSDSDHSQRSHVRTESRKTSTVTKAPVFDKNFTFSASPSPASQSPVPRQQHSYPPVHHQSPLHHSTPVNNEPQLFQPEWTFNEPGAMMQPKYAMQTPALPQDLDYAGNMWNNGQWDQSPAPFDVNMGLDSYPQQQLPGAFGNFPDMQDFPVMQPDFDQDFKNFIQVAT